MRPVFYKKSNLQNEGTRAEMEGMRRFTGVESAFFAGSIFAVLVCFPLLLIAQPTELKEVLAEDGIVENLGALSYFIASIGFIWLSWISRKTGPTWIWLALLGLLFFLCAGEEISWGQRYFGIETPEDLKKHNAQGEINLHNLWIFHYSNPDGRFKSGLETLLVPTRLLTLFFISYTIILPIICSVLPRIRTLCKKLSLPVPGWQPGVFFLTVLVTDAVAKQAGANTILRVNELKEMFYGVCAILLLINLAGVVSKDRI